MSRTTGTVKWFSQEKGFGFITRDDGPDVFVHHTSLPGTGFRKLDQGERVEFEVIEEPKGLKAQNVTRLDGGMAGDAQPRGYAERDYGSGGGERGGWNRSGDDRSGGARGGAGRSGGWNRDAGEGWR
jgi:CspA family cold shock protein